MKEQSDIMHGILNKLLEEKEEDLSSYLENCYKSRLPGYVHIDPYERYNRSLENFEKEIKKSVEKGINLDAVDKNASDMNKYSILVNLHKEWSECENSTTYDFFEKAVKIVEKYGADINYKDENGNSFAHLMYNDKNISQDVFSCMVNVNYAGRFKKNSDFSRTYEGPVKFDKVSKNGDGKTFIDLIKGGDYQSYTSETMEHLTRGCPEYQLEPENKVELVAKVSEFYHNPGWCYNSGEC